MFSNLPPPRFLHSWLPPTCDDEVDVEQAVAVDVGDRQAVAVVVVRRLVGPPRVVDDVVLEGDAAVVHAIGELEVVKGGDGGDGLELGILHLREPAGVVEIGRHVADRALLRLQQGDRGGEADYEQDGAEPGGNHYRTSSSIVST